MKGKSSYGIYTIFLLVIVFIGLVVWGKLPFLDPVRSFLGLETKITSGEVVEKIRAASYLTTTKYTIQVVAKSETPGFLIFGWAKMLIIAKGTVEAGIDLNQLAAKDVSVSEDGKSITVTLPLVMIRNRDYSLSNDLNDTRVYDASNGLFADTTNQQTQLRGAANNELIKSACQGGIMQQATNDTRIAIEGLLKTLLPDVNVTVSSAPVPSVEECIAE